MLPIGMIAALTVAMMDTCGLPPEQVSAPTEPVIVSTETVVAPTEIKEGCVYTIHGMTPPAEWQRYLYSELSVKGYEWYMPYAVCQIWQESCWNQYSTNGIDVGLTQQKAVYWQTRAAHWGVPGASIWDPYAQLHVFAGMMCQFLEQTGSVEWALSLYFWGNGDYAPKYIADVMSHWGALEVVR